MLKFPQFSEVSLGDRAFFESAKNPACPEISDFSFADVFGWRKTFHTQAAELNGNIVLLMKAFGKEEFFFLCPIGVNNIAETFNECLGYSRERFGYAKIQSIPENVYEILKGSVNDGKFTADRDYFDYLYGIKELAELGGSKYAGKRNFVKRFKNAYSYTLECINGSNAVECAEFVKKWCGLKKCDESSFLRDESQAVCEMLASSGELGLEGIIIRINALVEGFTLASALNAGTLQVHAEKANPGFAGIYQALNQLFAEKMLGKFEFVNREQDLGIPGLRKAKESYHPLKLVKKYSFTA